MDELFERETSERPIAPGGRAVLFAADSALMYRVPAADAASLAFGRVRANALDRTAHAEATDGVAAWAMNLAIGFATLGDYIDGPLAMIDGRIAPGAYAPDLRGWYADWVRGGGPLPVLRCGPHPYGLLPVTTAPAFAIGAAGGFRDLLEHHARRFRPDVGRRAANGGARPGRDRRPAGARPRRRRDDDRRGARCRAAPDRAAAAARQPTTRTPTAPGSRR